MKIILLAITRLNHLFYLFLNLIWYFYDTKSLLIKLYYVLGSELFSSFIFLEFGRKAENEVTKFMAQWVSV